MFIRTKENEINYIPFKHQFGVLKQVKMVVGDDLIAKIIFTYSRTTQEGVEEKIVIDFETEKLAEYAFNKIAAQLEEVDNLPKYPPLEIINYEKNKISPFSPTAGRD